MSHILMSSNFSERVLNNELCIGRTGEVLSCWPHIRYLRDVWANPTNLSKRFHFYWDKYESLFILKSEYSVLLFSNQMKERESKVRAGQNHSNRWSLMATNHWTYLIECTWNVFYADNYEVFYNVYNILFKSSQLFYHLQYRHNQ